MIEKLGGIFVIFYLIFCIYHGRMGSPGKDIFYDKEPIKFSLFVFILLCVGIYSIWRSYKKK